MASLNEWMGEKLGVFQRENSGPKEDKTTVIWNVNNALHLQLHLALSGQINSAYKLWLNLFKWGWLTVSRRVQTRGLASVRKRGSRTELQSLERSRCRCLIKMCKVSRGNAGKRRKQAPRKRRGYTADPSESIISASMRLPSNPKKKRMSKTKKKLRKNTAQPSNMHTKNKRHQNDWETAEKCCPLLLLSCCCCCRCCASCRCRALWVNINPYKCAEDSPPRKFANTIAQECDTEKKNIPFKTFFSGHIVHNTINACN